MIEPGIIIPFILGIPVIASAFFFVGFNIGFDAMFPVEEGDY